MLWTWFWWALLIVSSENRSADWASCLSQNHFIFPGLKCSFQTLAGACISPWVSRPCLDLVYLVFIQREEAQRMSEEEGKKRGEEEESEEGEGGYLTLSHLFRSALWHSKELPSFGNFSKAAVMIFEAAIKNKCFYILYSLFCQSECWKG